MIKQQGSNRIYSRETDPSGRSIIRVVGTNRDENRAFIYMARHFRALGLPVPELYSVSPDEMSYTQEDLGDTLLFDHLDDYTLLSRTIRALAHMQVTGARDFDWSVCFPVPAMDERSIRWDLNYFKYCFLKLTGIEFSEPRLEDEFDRLVQRLTTNDQGLPPTFLYRDFQSRNVMIRDAQPWFIDFQGGRRGPTQYDVASFLWQARANFAPELRERLIDEYLDELRQLQPSLAENAWRAALPHFVLFRTLQVLGAYGFRGYHERKPHFLQSIPNALRNLRDILTHLPEYPYLRELSEILLSTLTIQNTQITPNTQNTQITQITHSSPSSPRIPRTPRTPSLVVTVYSFSFKKGIPADDSGNGGGYVFDCRSTHNPGKYDEYKSLTGLDQPVIDFLEADGEILRFLESVYQLVDHHVERFLERGFTHLQVAFGCTGGQHRSVYSAEHLAHHLHEKYGVRVHLIHRERCIDKWLNE
ncbi:MAG: phosphotransferase [Paludibacteraceae bacterium]|nr:phosphotransferase [Paludibacteraceae bacterium]